MATISNVFDTPNYALAKKRLEAAALQHQANITNIGNGSTPGYQRVRVSQDFQGQLDAQAKSDTFDIHALQALEPTLEIDPTAHSIKPDGNNVDIDKEMIEMNQTSVEVKAHAQFITNSLHQITMAITGHTS